MRRFTLRLCLEDGPQALVVVCRGTAAPGWGLARGRLGEWLVLEQFGMSRGRASMPLVPSLLDRLIEPQRDEPRPRAHQGQSLSELEEAVRRDLQEMLNTRQSLLEPYPEESELSRSLLSFGLPDLGHLNPNSPDQRQLLQRFVERAIRDFEPRLTQVRVAAMAPDQDGRGLRMTIHALLRVAPAPVPVSFDTLVQSGSGKWQVVPPGTG